MSSAGQTGGHTPGAATKLGDPNNTAANQAGQEKKQQNFETVQKASSESTNVSEVR
jgi:hypothetical protein